MYERDRIICFLSSVINLINVARKRYQRTVIEGWRQGQQNYIWKLFLRANKEQWLCVSNTFA